MKLKQSAAIVLLFAVPSLAGTYEFEGRVDEPSWRMRVGDIVRGVLRIRDDAELEDEGEGFKTYKAAYVSMNIADTDFSFTAEVPWHVNDRAQGVGDAILRSGSEDARLDFSVVIPSPDLGVKDLEGREGVWGVVLRDKDQEEYNFWGKITSLRRSPVLASNPGDSAPVPEPSSAALLASAATYFASNRRRSRTSSGKAASRSVVS
jgi:hypothetical protein